jgi:GNAT superfamily N-acetyltransferase
LRVPRGCYYARPGLKTGRRLTNCLAKISRARHGRVSSKFGRDGRQPNLPQLLFFSRTSAAPQLIGGGGLIATARGETLFGLFIREDQRGLGLGYEAGQALIAMARDTLNLKRLVSELPTTAQSAAKLLHRLGFRADNRPWVREPIRLVLQLADPIPMTPANPIAA